MRFVSSFLALSSLGLLGILSLAPTLGPVLAQVRRMPGAPDVPDTALAGLLLLQPTLLLLAAVALGVGLAERAGLVSHILRRIRGEPSPEGTGGPGFALLLALGAGTVAAAADLILRRVSPESFAGIPRLDEVSLAGRISALLYGGLTEELIMRFGLMTLLVWLGTRVLGGRRPAWLVWAAIALAALAFAMGHLPALLSMTSPDSVLIVRTLGLNLTLGLVYGWLYAVRSVEHAMLAHMATHVVFWTATPSLVALGL